MIQKKRDLCRRSFDSHVENSVQVHKTQKPLDSGRMLLTPFTRKGVAYVIRSSTTGKRVFILILALCDGRHTMWDCTYSVQMKLVDVITRRTLNPHRLSGVF
jgi:hypothetical protein